MTICRFSPNLIWAFLLCFFSSFSVLAQYTNKASRVTKVRDLWEGGLLGQDLSGQGVEGWVYEGGEPFLDHVEFQGRVVMTTPAISTPGTHATWSCGAMAGAGVKYGTRGAAYQSQIVYSSTQNLLPSYSNWEDQWVGEAIGSNAIVTNFSFASGSANLEFRDNIFRSVPHQLGVQGANYSAPMWSSTSIKNVLTVGDVDCYSCVGQEDVDDSWCSALGPSKDGRIKPDIMSICDTVVATYNSICPDPTQCYGTYSCTSGATAWASGAMLLLQELSLDVSTELLSGYALKALVIHNAYDMWNPGPDYNSGWGLLDASKSAEFILLNGTCEDFEIYDGQLDDGGVYTFDIVSSGTKPIKATLTWFDIAGAEIDYQTPGSVLVNNLDLRVYRLDNGVEVEEFNAFNLDPLNPGNLAYTEVNNVDNVEQVVVDSPSASTYRVQVSHQGTLSEPQTFALCIGENPIDVGVDITNSSNVSLSDGAIDLSISGVNIVSYSWTGPNSFVASTEDITGLESGAYIVDMTSDTGCTYTRQFWVKCDCDADFNGDMIIDSMDLLGILCVYNTVCVSWGCCPGDFDDDNFIDSSDLTAFLAAYNGTCN